MTADVMPEVRKQCIDAGMWDVIYKPIDLQEVAEAIIRWGRKPKRVSAALSEEKQSTDTNISIKIPLERIEGMDIKKGLERVNNNRELYLRILQRFLFSVSAFQKKTNELLQNKKAEEIKTLLHSLKGVSGNLGATRVYEKLAETEKAFAHGIPEDAQGIINELNGLLETFRKSVIMVIGKEPHSVKPPKEKTDVKTLLTDLEKMKQRFEDNDAEGCEIFNKLYPKLLDIAETKLLKNAVDQYDFDKAIEITTLVIKKIKNNIS
jgi:HPt (histidine-containing phosphotransfer) domain-containing protein